MFFDVVKNFPRAAEDFITKTIFKPRGELNGEQGSMPCGSNKNAVLNGIDLGNQPQLQRAR
jgi:hypothetical protein